MKRVFFLSSQSLFGQGLESLLRREEGVDIVGREADIDLAIERIKALRPDVVIVDCTDPSCGPTSAVARLLKEGMGTRVVGVNLGNNSLCIYHGEERLVTDVGDLVKAIENNPFAQSRVHGSDDPASHG